MQKEFIEKNESEKFFEQYLDSNGYQGKWFYEPTIPGKNKKPDYVLEYNNNKHFFEVKELRKKPDEPNFPAFINPYKSLRSEINEARVQFKEYKGDSCSLVVFNIDDRQAQLDPLHVFAAMLGDLAFTMDYDSEKGKTVAGSERSVFSKKGKMINYKESQPQNTTINAIVVLEELHDNREIEKALRREIAKQDRHISIIDKIDIRMKLYEDHHVEVVPRVVVTENPFAKVPFPSDLFCGPYDERWRIQNDKTERFFAGEVLKEIESLKEDTEA
jgi:hypothetical protein